MANEENELDDELSSIEHIKTRIKRNKQERHVRKTNMWMRRLRMLLRFLFILEKLGLEAFLASSSGDSALQAKAEQIMAVTFTKAAAGEMADRIRKKIKKIPELKEQLDLLDSAYITTFDSYSLSLVKKYYYVLNLPNKIDITDEGIIKMIKRQKI